MERELAAILAADVVGHSRLMGEDATGTLQRLKSLRRELVQVKIIERSGCSVKLMGDRLPAEFPSVVEALRCAVDIQQDMAGQEADLPDERRIGLRIGVRLGDIIVAGSDIYGDGVRVAARLERLAEPRGGAMNESPTEAPGVTLSVPGFYLARTSFVQSNEVIEFDQEFWRHDVLEICVDVHADQE